MERFKEAVVQVEGLEVEKGVCKYFVFRGWDVVLLEFLEYLPGKHPLRCRNFRV